MISLSLSLCRCRDTMARSGADLTMTWTLRTTSQRASTPTSPRVKGTAEYLAQTAATPTTPLCHRRATISTVGPHPPPPRIVVITSPSSRRASGRNFTPPSRWTTTWSRTTSWRTWSRPLRRPHARTVTIAAVAGAAEARGRQADVATSQLTR